jgi:hypothetical protein
MIQRYLIDLLKDGFDAITADPLLLDDIFLENYGLAKAEVDTIKLYYAAHPVMLVNGYSRQDNKYPAIAITLGNEGESQTMLGDDAGMVDDEGGLLDHCDINSAIWEHTYLLTVISEHPDVTAYYYEMAKTILLAGLEVLIEKGLASIKMQGQELLLDPTYMPEHLFMRQIIFTCERELQQINRDSRLSKAFRIGGIAVDNSGSPSDVGGVKTNVSIYFADGEETDAGDQI